MKPLVLKEKEEAIIGSTEGIRDGLALMGVLHPAGKCSGSEF